MIPFRTLGLFALAAGIALAAGCATYGNMSREKMAAMPGLKDVHPLGPKGQKCYDFCAQAEANCKHMCPTGTFVGDCAEDCEIDTKVACIPDCPDIWRPTPVEN